MGSACSKVKKGDLSAAHLLNLLVLLIAGVIYLVFMSYCYPNMLVSVQALVLFFLQSSVQIVPFTHHMVILFF